MPKGLMLLFFASMICLTACGGSSVSCTISEGGSEAVLLSSSQGDDEPMIANLPRGFETPESLYWILGQSEWNDNQTLILYEEALPNKFTGALRDEVLHGIRWQIFDEHGMLLKKGDSGWDNGFPIHEHITALYSPKDGTISFDAAMPAEYNTYPFRRRFTLVIDDGRKDILTTIPNNDRYLTRDWYQIAQADGCLLEHSSGTLLFTSKTVEKSITLEIDDGDFYTELSRLNWPGEILFSGDDPLYSNMKVSLDAKSETAVLSIPKMTVTVNFQTGSVEERYHYTDDLLRNRVDQTLDGRYSIYTAGDPLLLESPSDGSDYVVVEPNGMIHHLFARNRNDTVLFAGNDRIIANTIDALTFYDPATGERLSQQPQFDYGTVDYQGKPQKKYLTIAIAVDAKNERILAAYRPNPLDGWYLGADGKYTRQFPVSLAVMDFSGKVLDQIDTGLLVSTYVKLWLVLAEITLDRQGNATISCEAAFGSSPVTVSYLS